MNGLYGADQYVTRQDEKISELKKRLLWDCFLEAVITDEIVRISVCTPCWSSSMGLQYAMEL